MDGRKILTPTAVLVGVCASSHRIESFWGILILVRRSRPVRPGWEKVQAVLTILPACGSKGSPCLNGRNSFERSHGDRPTHRKMAGLDRASRGKVIKEEAKIMKVLPILGIVVLLSMYIALLSDLILVVNPYPKVEESERMGDLKLIPW